MNLPAWPAGTMFYDVDFKPVACMPDRQCVCYSEHFRKDGESYPFPYQSPAFAMADKLSREQFAHWLQTGEGVWAAHQTQDAKQ